MATEIIAPTAALIISVATFIFTQIRSQRAEKRADITTEIATSTELRAVAKDTVDMIQRQVDMLVRTVDDLRVRLEHCEQSRADLYMMLNGRSDK